MISSLLYRLSGVGGKSLLAALLLVPNLAAVAGADERGPKSPRRGAEKDLVDFFLKDEGKVRAEGLDAKMAIFRVKKGNLATAGTGDDVSPGNVCGIMIAANPKSPAVCRVAMTCTNSGDSMTNALTAMSGNEGDLMPGKCTRLASPAAGSTIAGFDGSFSADFGTNSGDINCRVKLSVDLVKGKASLTWKGRGLQMKLDLTQETP